MPVKYSGEPQVPKASPFDGVATQDMTREQLEEFVMQMREELDQERQEKNYFQMECDKLNTFWEISKRQLADLSA
ncbi:dynein regulatory complex subunit 4-like [Convolutriloba macropyga]|uniref:dynein regulatory complex subunit 4-like n=1 Tax=Convolutriloba macropyga TaxID=536237 RepID=UPI003F528738